MPVAAYYSIRAQVFQAPRLRFHQTQPSMIIGGAFATAVVVVQLGLLDIGLAWLSASAPFLTRTTCFGSLIAPMVR